MKEKLRNYFQSIRFKLFAMFSLLSISVIALVVVVNNLISEKVYSYYKTQQATNIIEELNEYYSNPIIYEVDDIIRELEIKNNFEIYIEDSEEKLIYTRNREATNNIIRFKENQNGIIVKNENNIQIIVVNTNLSKTSHYIIVKGTLANGYITYIRIGMTPIKENLKVTNSTLALIGTVLVLVSFLAAILMSKHFIKPISKLNRITQKVANLDFSEKYRITDSSDEINNLGKNINVMSLKLEKTINQLRQNNSELEKDIEEKTKIDEMRKNFISDVSHELKTPIGLIQGYSEGLIENVNDDEESRKFYAEVISDEAKKMDRLVKRLLELMKLEYQEKPINDESLDLRTYVEEELRRETVDIKEKNITIEFDDSKAIKVFADRDCVEQIVHNYISNAIKNCEKIDGEKKIIIRTEKQSSSKIRLFVYNTGKQIPRENLEKIWGRFFKGDSSRSRDEGGTGIGLAIVKAIMINYGNDYGVQNFDNGVEFYCDFNSKKCKKNVDEK